VGTTKSVLMAVHDGAQAQRWAQALRDTRQWQVLDPAFSFAKACQALEQHRPDLLVTELRLRGGTALDLVRLLRSGLRPLTTQFLVIVRESDDALLLDALQEGADTFVSAESLTGATLAQHARDTLDGGAEIVPWIARRLLEHFGFSFSSAPKLRQKVEDLTNPLLLTETERQLLYKLSAGYAIAEVARSEGVRPRELTGRVRAIYRKMQWQIRAGDLSLQGG
jgi:DNA-binding NarL/FixJ family response regulator